MCLESKTIFPKIAKKDIVCYKVIDIENYSVYNRSYQYDEHKINKAIGGFQLIKNILFYFFCRKNVLFENKSDTTYISTISCHHLP